MEQRLLALWDKLGSVGNQGEGLVAQILFLMIVGSLLFSACYSLASSFISALHAFASRDANIARHQAWAQVEIAQAKAKADKDASFYGSITAQAQAIGATRQPTAEQYQSAPSSVSAESQFIKLNGSLDDLAHGYIYLIKGGDAYKIGMAKSVQDRIKQLSTGSAHKLVLTHCIATNAMYKAEALLHQHYSKLRLNGEWFNLTSGDVEYLKTIWRIDVRGLPVAATKKDMPVAVSTNGTAPQEDA